MSYRFRFTWPGGAAAGKYRARNLIRTVIAQAAVAVAARAPASRRSCRAVAQAADPSRASTRRRLGPRDGRGARAATAGRCGTWPTCSGPATRSAAGRRSTRRSAGRAPSGGRAPSCGRHARGAELCFAWAAACLAHESERHLDAAVDTVAAAHGALAADADDDGARDAGSPTLGDAPTPPGAPMARAKEVFARSTTRAWRWRRPAPPRSSWRRRRRDDQRELRRAARAAWTRRPSAPSSRHEAVSKVLRGMKAQHGVLCGNQNFGGAFLHAIDATLLVDFHTGGGDLLALRRARRPRRRRARKAARRQRGAVEVDGPSHFCADDPKRPLGHTRLKRLLEHAGLEAVSVPYYEWDRSGRRTVLDGARARLQRKLGITTRLVYDSGDWSSFAPLEGERGRDQAAVDVCSSRRFACVPGLGKNEQQQLCK